jgi:hypothetical protein
MARLRRVYGLASFVRVINFHHYRLLSRLIINPRKASGAVTTQTRNPTIIRRTTLRPCPHLKNSKRRPGPACEIMRLSPMVYSIVLHPWNLANSSAVGLGSHTSDNNGPETLRATSPVAHEAELNEDLRDHIPIQTAETLEELDRRRVRNAVEPNAPPLHGKVLVELTIPSHLTSRASFVVAARRTEMFQEHKSLANITITNLYMAVLLQLVVVVFYIHLALRLLIDGPMEMLEPMLITSLLLLAYGVSKTCVGRVYAGPDLLLTPLEYTRDVLREKAHRGLRAVTKTFVGILVYAVRVAIGEGLVGVEIK